MWDSIKYFQIENAKLHDEGDRPLVEGNIKALAVDTGLIGREATVQAALTAFNEIVRTQVPAAINRCLGDVGFRYHYIFAITYFQVLDEMDLLATCIQHSDYALWECCVRFDGVNLGSILYPVGMAVVWKASQQFLNLHGVANLAYLITVTLGSLAVLLAVYVAWCYVFKFWAIKSTSGCLVYWTMQLLGFLATIAFYRRGRESLWHSLRRKSDSMPDFSRTSVMSRHFAKLKKCNSSGRLVEGADLYGTGSMSSEVGSGGPLTPTRSVNFACPVSTECPESTECHYNQ